MGWTVHTEYMVEVRNINSCLVGKSEGKRPLVRHRCRWEENIKVDLTETGCEDVGWIRLAQDRNKLRAVVNTVINIMVIKGGTFLDQLSDY